MTLCIGWDADPPCDVFGDTHGCELPDPHPGAIHVCSCGLDMRGRRWTPAARDRLRRRADSYTRRSTT